MIDAVRKGENESWFREVNERLEDRAVDKPAASESFEIVCECAREECTERITISFVAYEEVRKESRLFIVVPGHFNPDIERIVMSHDGHDVIEKIGLAGSVAEVENPRIGKTPPDDLLV